MYTLTNQQGKDPTNQVKVSKRHKQAIHRKELQRLISMEKMF